MHISRIFKEREKVNIDMENANIESVFTAKNASHIDTLQKALKKDVG